jgi:hypothetical protein
MKPNWQGPLAADDALYVGGKVRYAADAYGAGIVTAADLLGMTGHTDYTAPYVTVSLDGNTAGGVAAVGSRFISEDATDASSTWL